LGLEEHAPLLSCRAINAASAASDGWSRAASEEHQIRKSVTFICEVHRLNEMRGQEACVLLEYAQVVFDVISYFLAFFIHRPIVLYALREDRSSSLAAGQAFCIACKQPQIPATKGSGF